VLARLAHRRRVGRRIPRFGPAYSNDVQKPAEGLTVTALNDQHAYLRDPAGTLCVGDWISFASRTRGPRSTAGRHSRSPMPGDRVTDLIRTFF
jgi:hypothetical protein